jgi:ferredoxin
MKKYIQQMLPSKGTKVAILAVNGAIIRNGKLIKGDTGQALEQVESILHRKKYDVFLTANTSFPDNWTQVTNPSSIPDTEIIIPMGEIEVRKFIEKFITEKRELFRCGFLHTLWSSITANLFGIIGRRILGKFYFADERCTGCSICVKACPVQTIKMSYKKPYWGNSCEDCNRCINICPEKAIQVSILLFIIHTIIYVVLTILAIRAILYYTPKWIQSEDLFLISIEIVLISIASLLVLWISLVPIDAFIQLFINNLGLRKIFGKSYTMKFRRYKAPDFNPIKNKI